MFVVWSFLLGSVVSLESLQQVGGQREGASGCLHRGAGSRRGLGTFSVQSWDFHTSPVPSVVPVPSRGLGV